MGALSVAHRRELAITMREGAELAIEHTWMHVMRFVSTRTGNVPGTV